MNVFVHKNLNVSINIFEWNENNEVSCVFFEKKPVVGDLLMSYTRGYASFLYLYRINEILENRDSKCAEPHDGSNAFFRVKVEMLNNPKTVYLPEGFEHINCSRRDNYQ